MTGSVQNGQLAKQRFYNLYNSCSLTHCYFLQPLQWLKHIILIHKTKLYHIDIAKKIEPIWYRQDFHIWIAQVKYWGQKRYSRILNCIQHRLESKYFLLAQPLLNAHQAALWPQKSETENLKLVQICKNFQKLPFICNFLAVNFGCDQIRIMPEIFSKAFASSCFPSFCTQPTESLQSN